MAKHPVPAVGGKDLRDFKSLSRDSSLNYLQKQALPASPGQARASRVLRDYAPSDYVRWIYEYCRFRLGPRHSFPFYTHPEKDNGIYALSGDGGEEAPVRVALASDWGSGTDEAISVAAHMFARRPHYTIHLGDVYFVGDAEEVRENFLGVRNHRKHYTPVRWPEGTKGSFALNGNHEMYARGLGYFDHMLPALGMRAHGPGQPQKASFFCLENPWWRVIALDTGYNSVGLPLVEKLMPEPDCALPEPLIAWLRDTLRQQDDKRGIVLLSHHQYYSRFDDWYVKPAEQLAEFIDRPVLWLWGHEHRMAVYPERRVGSGIRAYGRCIGHGGMPVDLPPAHPRHPEVEAEFVDSRPYVPDNADKALDVGINGFAALTFARDKLSVEYVDVFDKPVYRETWTADRWGCLSRSDVWAHPMPSETPSA